MILLTDKDTSKTRYGICHNFYLGDGESRGSLTSMCILTNHQFISGFRTVLATLKKIIDSGTVPFLYKTNKGTVHSSKNPSNHKLLWERL